MENKVLEIISGMTESIANENWKVAIDELVRSLRKIFVFDIVKEETKEELRLLCCQG